MLPNDPNKYTWYILPGRKVSHAVVTFSKGTYWNSICGQSAEYKKVDLLEPFKDTHRCTQCLQAIVVRGLPYTTSKAYHRLCSATWREFLAQNPDLAPATWRNPELGRATHAHTRP